MSILLEPRIPPSKILTDKRDATIGVVVERCRSIVDVFWSSKETKPANCQQFIEHAEVKKKVSLKTLAKVLSIHTSNILLIQAVSLHSRPEKLPQSQFR